MREDVLASEGRGCSSRVMLERNVHILAIRA